MDTIPAESLVKVFTYLLTSEIARSFLVCKRFNLLRDELFLWEEVFQNAAVPSLRNVMRSKAFNAEKICNVSRQLEAMSQLESLCWSRLKYSTSSLGPQLEKMEAHTITLLLGRFAVIVGGWGASTDNNVDVIDCSEISSNNLITINAFTQRAPRFRYGFSTLEYQGRLLVYGGCRGGGYSHDCNDLYVVDIKFQVQDPLTGEAHSYFSNSHCACAFGSAATHTPISGAWDAQWDFIAGAQARDIRQVTALYSSNLTAQLPRNERQSGANSAYIPVTRAYHTAVAVQLDGRDCMLVWGGLHRREPTGQLELLDIQSLAWRRGMFSGQEPSPRFGHSCVLMPGSDCKSAGAEDRLIFTGGSDGNDLVRNGSELREIHVLHVVRSPQDQVSGAAKATAAATVRGCDELVWSTPRLSTVPQHLRPQIAVPGRCHSAVRVGERVLYFGGGADSTNNVLVLHAPPLGDHWALGDQQKSTGSSSLPPGTEAGTAEQERAGYSVYFPAVAALRGIDNGAGTGAGTGTAGRVAQSRPYPFPRPRLSAAALLAGRYVLVMGGFSVEHREMGDVWVLDLAYGTSDQRCLLDRPASVHRAKRFGAAGAVVSDGCAGLGGPGGAYEAESELGEAEGGSSDEAEEEPGAADSDSLEGGGGAEPQGFQAQLLNQLMLAGLLQQPGAALDWLNILGVVTATGGGAGGGDESGDDASGGSADDSSGSGIDGDGYYSTESEGGADTEESSAGEDAAGAGDDSVPT